MFSKLPTGRRGFPPPPPPLFALYTGQDLYRIHVYITRCRSRRKLAGRQQKIQEQYTLKRARGLVTMSNSYSELWESCFVADSQNHTELLPRKHKIRRRQSDYRNTMVFQGNKKIRQAVSVHNDKSFGLAHTFGSVGNFSTFFKRVQKRYSHFFHLLETLNL